MILCGFPSAANVAGEGEPPFTVTVALGAELLRVTVMGWISAFTVKVTESKLALESVKITV